MSRKSALAATGFFRLWTAESVSMVGSQITVFALPLVAVLTLRASAWQMGLLTASASLAVLLLGLSAGVWADQYDRRAVMLGANAVRGVVLLSVPVLYWFDELDLTVLLVVSFTVGAMSLLFDSAMSAYLPRLVGDKELTAANSWIQATESVGDVGGPGLAGIVVQVLGAPVTILVDSVSYLVSSISLLTLPAAPPETGHDRPDQSHRQAIAQGLKLLWSNRILRPLAVAAAHFNLFTSMFFALFVLYAVKVLDFSPFLLGLVTTVGGVAGLLGATAAGKLSRRFGAGRTMMAAYAIPGTAGLLVPVAASFGTPVAVACLTASTFFWSFCVVILLITGMSLRQRLVPDEFRGRVSATFRFIAWGIEPLGGLLGGLLGSSALGLRGTMTLAALGIVPSALWVAFSRVRKLGDVASVPTDLSMSASPSPSTREEVTQ
ncbi:MFS transporter [Kitasatospora sp. NPDC059571]|uniref:MFS transporter n=1 Tax=Kitasatospora sp. NPDC059571 TaxID=3346871 RepID=UPI0036910BFD